MEFQYANVIQAQILHILDSSFKLISEKILCKNIILITEWQTFTTSHSITQLQFQKHDFDKDIVEDLELKPTSQENFQAYKINLNEKIQSTSRINTAAQKSLKNHFKSHMTQFNWDKEYHYSLIHIPEPEVVISTADEQFRRMKIQQINESNKQKELQQQQLKEKKKLNEMNLRLKQQLSKKEYTYDYNCQLIINKHSQLQAEIVPQIKFEILQEDQNKQTKKYQKQKKEEIQQQVIKKKSKEPLISQNTAYFGESKSFFVNNSNEDENFDRQTSNIPFIKLSRGVRLREDKHELIFDLPQPPQIQFQMRESSYIESQNQVQSDQLRLNIRDSSKEKVIKNNKSCIKTERNFDYLKVEQDDNSYRFKTSVNQQLNQSVNKSQYAYPQVIDNIVLKQDLVKLPKVRSRSINIRSKKNRQINIHSKDQINNSNV
ncbi:unnamed protein product [Paramecium sonneborni]|uniref:Uncharacterized protein n=1 Tax=Paramecium sonneborni TaxID=65129 RepID=A0A8S1QRV2_9CILI|nr:unnamed protein product [Paramecium sonneborni]